MCATFLKSGVDYRLRDSVVNPEFEQLTSSVGMLFFIQFFSRSRTKVWTNSLPN